MNILMAPRSWREMHNQPLAILTLVLALSTGRVACSAASPTSYARPNSGPEAMDIIKERGFIGERYIVKSEDGYKLVVTRIVNPLADARTLNRYPVALLHGIGGDSAQLISQSSRSRPRRPILGQITQAPGDECLAFMLANNNFDVFLVDARGSSLNDHDAYVDYDLRTGAKFYNFTLDEQAMFDTPAVLEFILSQTGAEKLHYVGYSETTLFMFAHLATRPAQQSKLASFVALAPVAYVSHSTGSAMPGAQLLALFPDELSFNYFPQLWIDTVGTGLRQLCSQKLGAQAICLPVARSIAGQGGQSDPTNYFSTTFKGTSIRAFKHLLQLHNQRRFGMYDYGPAGNLAKYGQPRAPDYDLSRITMPNLVLFRGGEDFLSDPGDQETLISKLGTRPLHDFVIPKFNHLDFLVSDTVLADVNLPMARVLLELTRQQAFPRTPHKQPFEVPARPSNRVLPVGVAIPGQITSKMLTPQSRFLNNLLKGVLDEKNTNGAGAIDQLTPAVQSLGLLRNSQLTAVLAPQRVVKLGNKLDTLNFQLEQLPSSLINPLIN